MYIHFGRVRILFKIGKEAEVFFNLEHCKDPNITDGIFDTGAYGVPSKSQDPTVLGQGGPSSTQCSKPSWT